MCDLNNIDMIKEVEQELVEYRVKRLRVDDLQELYDFCKANTTYYRYMRMEPTMENILESFTLLPPNKDMQGQGVGRKIIDSLIKVFRNIGFSSSMLGCIKDNVEANSFWTNNGFEKTGRETDTGDYIIVEMRKQL